LDLAAPSLHSRAARRATSPGIDTDKSLKKLKPPTESIDSRPSVLAHHGGGIKKKAKHGRKAVLSTKARRRRDKAMDMAEAVLDRTATKIERSKGQSKVIKSRKQTWDDINKRLVEGQVAKHAGMDVAKDDTEDDDDFEDVSDDGMDAVEQTSVVETIPVATRSVADEPGDNLEDEIL
jgi:hypothetical protein